MVAVDGLGRGRDAIALEYASHFAQTRSRAITFGQVTTIVQAGRTKVVAPYSIDVDLLTGERVDVTGVLELDVASVDGRGPRIIRAIHDERAARELPTMVVQHDRVVGFHDVRELGWFPHLTDSDRRSLAWYDASAAADLGSTLLCAAKLGWAGEMNPVIGACGSWAPACAIGLKVASHYAVKRMLRGPRELELPVKLYTAGGFAAAAWNLAVCL